MPSCLAGPARPNTGSLKAFSALQKARQFTRIAVPAPKTSYPARSAVGYVKKGDAGSHYPKSGSVCSAGQAINVAWASTDFSIFVHISPV